MDEKLQTAAALYAAAIDILKEHSQDELREHIDTLTVISEDLAVKRDAELKLLEPKRQAVKSKNLEIIDMQSNLNVHRQIVLNGTVHERVDSRKYIHAYEEEIACLQEQKQTLLDELAPLETAYLKAGEDVTIAEDAIASLAVNLFAPHTLLGRATEGYKMMLMLGGLLDVLILGDKDSVDYPYALEWLDHLHDQSHKNPHVITEEEGKAFRDDIYSNASRFEPNAESVRAGAIGFKVTDQGGRNLSNRPTRESVPLNSDVKAPSDAKQLPRYRNEPRNY